MNLTANANQIVTSGNDVLFTDTPIRGNCSILHREGSGLVTVRGITNQCRARYRVSFGGNIAIPEGGTVEAISLAIAIDGEGIATTTMTVTPAAVEEFFNIFSSTSVDVPAGCCSQVSVRNISTQDVEVQNANFTVERVA